MSEGVLQQVGTPQALYDPPVNGFVAGFIGSPSMNFIDVTVRGPGMTPASSSGDWSIPPPGPDTRVPLGTD